MPGLPDSLSDYPEVQRVAEWLRTPVDVLLVHLRNQDIYAGPTDRVPPDMVFAALDRELAAGRPFAVVQMERAR